MDKQILISRVLRRAVATTLACGVPHARTAPPAPVTWHCVSAVSAVPETLAVSRAQDRATVAVISLGTKPTEWNPRLEREFKRLGMQEAGGSISAEALDRLELLNRWRNDLIGAPTAEEVLLQIRRDRLLARMEAVLNDYVEFAKTDRARAGSS